MEKNIGKKVLETFTQQALDESVTWANRGFEFQRCGMPGPAMLAESVAALLKALYNSLRFTLEK